MSQHFLFVPGWGMDRTLWDGVLAALGAASCTVAEPGYYGAVPVGLDRLSAEAGAGATVIAVGHSFGVMQILAAPPPALAGLVAINGFSRFSAGVDHPAGIAPRVLARMAERLRVDCRATLRDFRSRCGLEGALPGPPDPERLQDGFHQLAHGDCRAQLAAAGVAVAALAGERDAIVPQALTDACFVSPQWVEAGGHLLPLSDPDRCARVIRALAAICA